MDPSSFGQDDYENGSLNNMLEQVGIDDVGSFVDGFRQQANLSATNHDPNNAVGMFQGAIDAYQMFTGHQNGRSSNGGFFNQMNSSIQNAQKMYAMYKQFDRNGDGKITTDDIEVILKEMGCGVASPCTCIYFIFLSNNTQHRSNITNDTRLDLARALFESVDQNHNGTLDFTDLMALATMLNKLYGQYNGGIPH
jgi:Ca2+-binding EF-hand superfamily protein